MRLQLLLWCMVLVGGGPGLAEAQESDLEPPGALVVALDVALYNASATVQAPTDAAAAALATDVLHATLAKLLPGQIADSAAVQTAARSDAALAVSGRHPCNVIVACARAVA